jgi:hypothetical protein
MLGTIIGLVMLMANPAKSQILGSSNVILASHSFSLEDRYANTFVDDVFKDNILLTLAYMDSSVKDKADISWSQVEAPFHYEFTLEPGQEFAFHDKTLPDFSKNIVQTTNAHFNWDEGFKYDGDITGDGVCHLASLIYWTAEDAGLTAYAPSNHNFAKIPDVPKEYGVAIMSPSPLGNLYIVDSLNKPVNFVFNYDGSTLSVSVSREEN